MSTRWRSSYRIARVVAGVTLGIAATALAGDIPDAAPAARAEPDLRQVAPADGSNGPRVEEQNGISYVSGGVGSDEAAALDRMRGRFNLKLTMTVPGGEYTSPATLRIEKPGGAMVLDVRPNGPLFLAALPAGEYVIHADAEGRSLTRKVMVPAEGQEQLTLTWPSADDQRPDAND